MGAVLIDYLDDREPITFDDVAAQCRLDDDDERSFIERFVIPGVRHAAESKSGAAIRKGRYVDRLSILPQREIPLSVGQVFAIDTAAFQSATGQHFMLSEAQFDLIQLGRETLLAPREGDWPSVETITLTYRAGIDLNRFPSVRCWLLLAAAWAYENREMFLAGRFVATLPGGYVDELLSPITVPPRF